MNHGYVTRVQLWLCIIVLRPSQINSLSNQVVLNLIETVIHQLLPSPLLSAEQQTFLLIRKREGKFLYWQQLRIQSNKRHTGDKYVASIINLYISKIAETLNKEDGTCWGLDWDRLLESSCSRFAIKYFN